MKLDQVLKVVEAVEVVVEEHRQNFELDVQNLLASEAVVEVVVVVVPAEHVLDLNLLAWAVVAAAEVVVVEVELMELVLVDMDYQKHENRFAVG
jgi:hypothetical protein